MGSSTPRSRFFPTMRSQMVYQIYKSEEKCHQGRSDRDDYIKILWDNIKEEKHFQFKKYGPDVVTHFNLPYDYTVLLPHHETPRALCTIPTPPLGKKQTG